MAKEDELRRKKEKKETISASMAPNLIQALDEYCEENGFYRANVIELALEEYLAKRKKKQ